MDYTAINKLPHPYNKPNTPFDENIPVYKKLLRLIDDEIAKKIASKSFSSDDANDFLRELYSTEKTRENNYKKLIALFSRHGKAVLRDVKILNENPNSLLIPPSSIVHQHPAWYKKFDAMRDEIFSFNSAPLVIRNKFIQRVAKALNIDVDHIAQNGDLKKISFSQLKFAGIKWLLKQYFPELSDAALLYAQPSVFTTLHKFSELTNISKKKLLKHVDDNFKTLKSSATVPKSKKRKKAETANMLRKKLMKKSINNSDEMYRTEPNQARPSKSFAGVLKHPSSSDKSSVMFRRRDSSIKEDLETDDKQLKKSRIEDNSDSVKGESNESGEETDNGNSDTEESNKNNVENKRESDNSDKFKMDITKNPARNVEKNVLKKNSAETPQCRTEELLPGNFGEDDSNDDSIVVKDELIDNTIFQSDEHRDGFSHQLNENKTLQTISAEHVHIARTNDTSVELSINQREAHHLDDNYYFFMSLLPHIKTLPAEQQMLLRMQMQELVYKEVYKKKY